MYSTFVYMYPCNYPCHISYKCTFTIDEEPQQIAMANTNSPQSITDWYNSCLAAFENITASIQLLDADDDSGSKHELEEKKVNAMQLVRDQMGRFRVWAWDIGANNPEDSYTMSLDYKLKEATLIRKTVLELLADLHTSLLERAYNLN